MTLSEALLLGVVQGLTEFLPVSSSGHLVLGRLLLDLDAISPLYDVLLHAATLAAICVVYARRIGTLARAAADLLRPPAQRAQEGAAERALLGRLLLATAVTGAVGLALQRLGVPRDGHFVAVMLLVTALILVLARVLRGAADPIAGWRPGWVWALLIGLVQGLAVLPGISRSGSTIAIGVIGGADREQAADFSFLAAIPATLGAVVVSLGDAPALAAQSSVATIIAGSAAAFLVGYLALRLLLRVVRGGRLHLFALYLVPLAAVALALLPAG